MYDARPRFLEKMLLNPKIAPADHDEPTIGQYSDGTWYWLDETWNYGNDTRYATREAASEAQARYCAEVLG